MCKVSTIKMFVLEVVSGGLKRGWLTYFAHVLSFVLLHNFLILVFTNIMFLVEERVAGSVALITK